MHMVKRRGHREKYDERKVYASVFAACLSAHVPEKDAEEIAAKASESVSRWIGRQQTVTAHQIYAVVEKDLKKRDRNAAFMYQTHMDVS